MKDNLFLPTELTAEQGGVDVILTFKNEGSNQHGFTFEGKPDTADLAPGQTQVASMQFADPGRYTFYCKYYPDTMTGVGSPFRKSLDSAL